MDRSEKLTPATVDMLAPALLMTPDSREELSHAFDAALFLDAGQIALDKLVSFLRENHVRGLDLHDPKALEKEARALMVRGTQSVAAFDTERFAAILDLFAKTGLPLHSPGYMGRQFSSPLPLASLWDLLNAVSNQPSSFYEAGQFANVADKIMAAELAQLIGWDPERSGMITTSGGSLANLTAILSAKNAAFGNTWAEGMRGRSGEPLPAIAVSEDAHYSIARAAGILGIGENQVVRLPLNEKRQIDVSRVAAELDKAAANGLAVFCIAASLGSTTTGAIDPLEELGAIAHARNTWFHVDGAHGGGILLSDALRTKTKGLHLADSFIMDAHKMLFMPGVCTMLFYRDREKGKNVFRQEAAYVFDEEKDKYAEFENADQTFECTKRPLIMNFWLAWSMYGRKFFSDKVEHLCRVAQEAYQVVAAAEDFEPVHQPEINIFCFRYHPKGLAPAASGMLQRKIQNQVRAEGRFFISSVDLEGVCALRAVIMNHDVGTHHVGALLEEIRAIGQVHLAGSPGNGTAKVTTGKKDAAVSVHPSNHSNPAVLSNAFHEAVAPGNFISIGHRLLNRLAEFLRDDSIRGLRLRDPLELSAAVRELMGRDAGELRSFSQTQFNAIVDLYLATGIPVHSPGYMGRQFSGVLPVSGVMDMVCSALNQPASFYESGQLPCVAEHIMGEEFNRYIGWEQGQYGIVTTSGGTMGNMTALLTARNKRYGSVWEGGMAALRGGKRPAIALSADAHYSISRAAGILGIGEDQVVRLPVNERRQIDISKAEAALQEAALRNLDVFALVASAGTTSVGAFDDLEALARITRPRNIWLHVDGAHGGSLLVSEELRYKLRGVAGVDSFLLDAHKMLFVPGTCTLLFYRDKKDCYSTFRQDPTYIFEREPNSYGEFDGGRKNFECTKRPLIMNLWTLWALHGPAVFAEKIELLVGICRNAYEMLCQSDDFYPLHEPEANILCFRYRSSDPRCRGMDDLQLAIQKKVRERGRFFISKDKLEGETVLRLVIMNHRIDTDHILGLLNEIREAARLVLAEAELIPVHHSKPIAR